MNPLKFVLLLPAVLLLSSCKDTSASSSDKAANAANAIPTVTKPANTFDQAQWDQSNYEE